MLTQIIALLKTLMMKDTDPAELNKPWYQRRRYIHATVAVIGLVLYYKWGLVLDNDMKDLLMDNYEVITTSIKAAVAAFITVWGVVGHIRGQVGATKKLKSALDHSNYVISVIDERKAARKASQSYEQATVTQEIADAINKDSMQFPAKKPDPMQHPALKPESIPNDIDLPESPKNP